MKKSIVIGFICMLLTGCTSTLDDAYQETKLQEAVTEIIQYLNDEQYDAITAMGDEVMNTPETTKKIQEAWSSIKDQFGSFKDIERFDYAGKNGNAIVIAVAGYEHNNVQFTITFNKVMQLVGIYFK